MRNRSGQPEENKSAGAVDGDDKQQWVREQVERAQRGEEDGFANLFRHHLPAVYRQMVMLVGSSGEAEDAAQEVFVQAFRNIAKFDFRTRFSAWLRGFAVRVALNTRRGRARRQRAMVSLAEETRHLPASRGPDSHLSVVEQVTRLDRLLARESEKSRIAFLLYYFEQLPVEEIATAIDASIDATRARIKRTRRELVRSVERQDTATAQRLALADQQEEEL